MVEMFPPSSAPARMQINMGAILMKHSRNALSAVRAGAVEFDVISSSFKFPRNSNSRIFRMLVNRWMLKRFMRMPKWHPNRVKKCKNGSAALRLPYNTHFTLEKGREAFAEPIRGTYRIAGDCDGTLCAHQNGRRDP